MNLPRVHISKELVQDGDRLIPGLSGGPDSVFLVHALASLQESRGLSLFLAHVNYKLRGTESDEDEAFCRGLATRLQLPLEVKVCDLSGKRQTTGNLQAMARQLRMEFFQELLQKHRAAKIALAHTLDDQVETILGNILRGCGFAGLAGMAHVIGPVVRPLLDISKAEILKYLDGSGIAYRIDRSNFQSDYTRNRIRNELIPHLKANFNLHADDALIRLGRLAGLAQAFLEREVATFRRQHVQMSWRGSLIVRLPEFRQLERILQLESLRSLVRELAPAERSPTSLDLLESALDILEMETGAQADLGCGIALERGKRELVVSRPLEEVSPREVPWPERTRLTEFGLTLNSELVESSEADVSSNDAWTIYLDPGRLQSPLVVRTFQPGDRFQPLGFPARKKLGDFFTDRGTPTALRGEIPLLVSCGEIVWVVGEAISETARVGACTRRLLKLSAEQVVRSAE